MKKVLIADDDAALRRLVRATLEGGNCAIWEATDGAQAISMAREQHPDLIVLDIPLPDRQGIEICRTLKADPATSQSAIIVLAAGNQSPEREQFLAAGANHYLAKPFSPLELLKLSESVLAH